MLPARLKANHYKPKERLRSTAHRDWVPGHFCSVPGCQLMPIEVAHVSRAYSGGMGDKSSDAMTVAYVGSIMRKAIAAKRPSAPSTAST